jgi:hypothetical protein
MLLDRSLVLFRTLRPGARAYLCNIKSFSHQTYTDQQESRNRAVLKSSCSRCLQVELFGKLSCVVHKSSSLLRTVQKWSFQRKVQKLSCPRTVHRQGCPRKLSTAAAVQNSKHHLPTPAAVHKLNCQQTHLSIYRAAQPMR